MITRMPEVLCPTCHATLDAASDMGFGTMRRSPRAGDRTICTYCSTVLQFVTIGTVRVVTEAEILTLPVSERWELRVLQGVVAAMQDHDRRNLPGAKES